MSIWFALVVYDELTISLIPNYIFLENPSVVKYNIMPEDFSKSCDDMIVLVTIIMETEGWEEDKNSSSFLASQDINY